jgi:glycosyltransferase involved in cell wall biosynthesis
VSAGSAVRPQPTGRPPRLLVVATVYNMIYDFLLPFALHYRGRGWRVDALAQPDDTLAECARAFDRTWEIGWSRHPSELRDIGGQLRALREIVARERYDLVHVHTPIAGLMTRIALRSLRGDGGLRVLYTAHGLHFHSTGSRLSNAAYLTAEKLAGRWTDYLVVINAADEAAARRHTLVPADRLVRMPGIGIDTDSFNPDRVSAEEVARVRSELRLDSDDQLVLMIAEFTANKRHADAVRAFAGVGRRDVHLAIAGRDGPTLAATRRLVARLGLEGRVHFLGFRRDILVFLRAATATLLLSGREGLPRSVLESLSMGTPVVGTRIRGVTDLLARSGGQLVEVGDVDGAAQVLRRLLDHPEEARAEGERGRRSVDAYDVRRVIAMHDALYARALRQEPVADWGRSGAGALR